MKRLLPLLLSLGACGMPTSAEPPNSPIEPPSTYLTLTIDPSTPVMVPLATETTEVEVGPPPIPPEFDPSIPLVAYVDALDPDFNFGVERLPARQVTETLPPPATTLPRLTTTPSSGGCAQWAGIFLSRGATADDVAFFVDGGILKRESGCGIDVLNDSSGDTGPCQIAPIHNRAGYFGGKYWGEGGWLGILHGLRTRENVRAIEWVDACITLRNVCGNGPWRLGDYGCANRRIFG